MNAREPAADAAFAREVPESDTVISATADASGHPVVLSRYGDDQWELWPYFDQSNIAPAAKRIDWRSIPDGMRGEFKAVVYRYWTEGLPGLGRPVARSVFLLHGNLRAFAKYLKAIGVKTIADVRPLHVSSFIHHRKTIDKVKPGTLARNLIGVEMLHRFRSSEAGLPFEPWPGSSAVAEAGWTDRGRVHGTTPLIPPLVLQRLYSSSELLLERADRLLDERDRGMRITGADVDLNLVRDACFFLLGVLTGMRCEEIIGIEMGAARTEHRSGTTFHWVRSIEHKTKKGNVEYLMPAIGLRVLAVMERWSAPLREELRSIVADGWKSAAGRTDSELLRRHADAQADANRIFLGRSWSTRQVRAISGASCIQRMQLLADHVGVDWRLRPHQLRRAYAWAFARHKLGNLLFLKEQFKHSSISTTQLYAANPMQDEALYDDLFNEVSAQKIELVEGWLNSDQPLAGRAGERIAKLRAHHFADRTSLVEETMEAINIRSTGHSWCLAQDEGCGGAGLYEPTRCAGCADAVIDGSQQRVWEEIHAHQLELVAEAATLGPATEYRVARDLRKTEVVLAQLGWRKTNE